MNLLHNALHNTKNDQIYDLTFRRIEEIKYAMLNELNLSPKLFIKIITSLKNYKYIDNLNEIREGSYIRWIKIDNDDNNELYLNKGALYCNIVITDNAVGMICKKIIGQYFTIYNLDQYIFFQKLSEQEISILNAIENIEL
jgi:hypothetical protein